VSITADTNVLLRARVQDDPEQAKALTDLMEQAVTSRPATAPPPSKR
jgi:hypothetical protein